MYCSWKSAGIHGATTLINSTNEDNKNNKIPTEAIFDNGL